MYQKNNEERLISKPLHALSRPPFQKGFVEKKNEMLRWRKRTNFIIGTKPFRLLPCGWHIFSIFSIIDVKQDWKLLKLKKEVGLLKKEHLDRFFIFIHN